jgi:signal transduction histidine kinase
LNIIATPLNRYLEERRTVFQSEAAARQIHFDLSLDCEATVNLDLDQMQQVLLNLVRNAVEATPAGGRIKLSCYREGHNAVMAVSDTGDGITEQDLPRIFDLYFTTKLEGTGMGLSLANQIVQAHGGVIEVESEDGKGSVFRVVLPLAAESLE